MANLYTTRVTAVGGRSGTIRSDDGLLNLKLSLPTSLGGKGDATNPEQLFAGGYAACFENAVIHIARREGQKVSDDAIEVIAEAGIRQDRDGGFQLSVSLAVSITGLEREAAEEIVAAAHRVCPYSNAVRGNIGCYLGQHEVRPTKADQFGWRKASTFPIESTLNGP